VSTDVLWDGGSQETKADKGKLTIQSKPLENFPPLYEEVPEAAAPAGV
jgi:hypothetical protein